MTPAPLILLVEDEAAHAELVCRAFEAAAAPPRVRVVATLAAAQAALAGDCRDANLVIADWRLPDGEATELLRGPAPPVVIMTSQGNERVAVEAMKAGAVDYVVKSEAALQDMPHVAERALRHARTLRDKARMQEALLQSEEKYRHLLEDIPDMVYVVDDQGILTYVSPAVRRAGYEPGDVVGRPFFDFVDPADRDLARQRFQEAAAGGLWAFEHRFRTRAGDVRWGATLGRATIVDGRLTELRGVLRDVTEKKLAEQALAEHYRAEQQHARRLEELGLLKSNFMILTSHEMRTPLTVLRGYVEILLSGQLGEPTAAQSNALSVCLKTVDRMIGGLSGILELLQIERGVRLELANVDLRRLLEEVVLELRPFMERRAQNAILELPAALPELEADPAKLRTVFSDLVLNAIKFTPDAGEIRLRAETCAEGVQVSVADSGIGLERIELERIFEPFYTVPDTRHHRSGTYEFEARGAGIGLAIVRGHVQAHGGRAWAESGGAGSGSRFFVVLPLAPPEPALASGRGFSC